MKMETHGISKHKVIALVLCLCLAACLLFPLLEAGHDCSGEHCAVCARIILINTLLKTFGKTSFAVFLLTGISGLASVPSFFRSAHFTETLTALKVKLSY